MPWQYTRFHDGQEIEFINTSSEVLAGVQATLSGPGVMPLDAPLAIVPGGAFVASVRGHDLARSTLLILGWRRENGDAYLWRVSF